MQNRFRRIGPFVVCGFIAVSLLARQPGRSAPAPAELVTVGVDSLSGARSSFGPVLSSDGRFVLFVSYANNLVSNDNQNPHLDLFLRDRISGTTTLLSVDRSGVGGGNGDSGHASISIDGRFVVFASHASNLVPNDTNESSDVFLRNLESGTTTLVSATPSGGVSSTRQGSFRPVMTPDARRVAFESMAPDLAVGATNRREVLVRNLPEGTTVVASVGGDRFGSSYDASISHDGSRVAFVSTVPNLVPGHTNSSGDVYVRNLQENSTIRLRTDFFGSNAVKSFHPVISSDGRYVAFKAASTNAPGVHVFWHDLETGSTALLAMNSHPNTHPSVSLYGLRVAFEDNNAIYLRNSTGAIVPGSVQASGGGPANGVSLRPVLTPDGNHLAFVSSGTDLVSDPPPLGTNLPLVYVRQIVGMTRLASVNTNGEPSTHDDMEFVLPAISADGRLVAFDSEAADLVANDRNGASDIFVRDLSTNRTELVSRRLTDRPPRTGAQSASISPFSISADAKRIVFTSYDDPREPNDTNGMLDVFLYDADTGSVRALSHSNGVFLANASGIDPVISANGEYVAFVRSRRTGNFETRYDLLWQRLDGGPVIQLVTNASSVTYPTDVRLAVLSSNGTVIVFAQGSADNYHRMQVQDLVAGTKRAVYAVSWMNRGPQLSPNEEWVVLFGNSETVAPNIKAPSSFSGPTTRLSRISSETNLPAVSGEFDGTGRYFAFDGGGVVYRFDYQATNHVLVCTNCRQPALNSNGSVAVVSAIRAPSAYADIYLIDVATGASTLVSRNYSGTGGGNNHSTWPSISRDGRYVVYVSSAGDLVLNDSNNAQDIFVYDRVQKSTLLVSRNRAGTGSANALSSGPVLSRDGRTIVFQSFAGDLVEGDYNERRDIFVAKLGVGDSDNDGMEDDWEVAQFGNLNRDGAGDQDGDGQTDLQEYLAGTSPTNDASILRVLTVTPLGGGSTTVVWSAVVGRDYIVQFKDALDAEWSNASGMIGADSTSMSFAHNSSSPQRFYRVITVE